MRTFIVFDVRRAKLNDKIYEEPVIFRYEKRILCNSV